MTDNTLEHRVDDICDQFETSLRHGQRPSIEQQLDLISAEAKRSLFAELMHLDLHYRSAAGEACSPSEYLPRFEEFQAEIERAFDGLQQEHAATATNAAAGTSPAFDEPTLPDPCATPTSAPRQPAGSPDLPAIRGYAVTGEIARGGMGRVLAARDLTLGREVAIKVLLPTSSRDASARFVTESKVTARLPHPGIPPVYALGELAGGGPFLAMKLVRGLTLADLLRERETPSDDLVRWVGVFEQVCQAVRFAHSQGILHRDLKPANVMVGAFGEVHVMDWGLAKEIQPSEDRSPSEDTANGLSVPTGFEHPAPRPNATAAGRVMGTPQYMAPEQARGEVVDARADVFALGGILSVVLTGQPAFTGATMIQVLGKAAAGSVGEALDRLAGCGADAELVELARRCLAPDRADRPADGSAVAEMVGAYRAGVQARLRQAQAERAAADARAAEQRKRRRVWAVASAAVIGVLAAGGSVAGWQWFRAEDALEQVTTEQQNTQAALDELRASRDRNVRNLRRVTKKLVPDLMGRKRKLSDGDRSFIRGLLPMWEEVAAARGDTHDALELRAAAHFSVARLQGNLGQYAEAEQAYRAALTTYEDLSRKVPGEPGSHQAVARAHNNLGTALASLGRVTEALDEMREALAIQGRLAAEFPDEPGYHRDLARSHVNVGNQLSDQGKNLEEALGEYRSAQDILQRLTHDYPDEHAYPSDLAGTHLNLGNLFHRLGKVRETFDQYRAAVNLYEDLAGRYPDESEYRKNFAAIRTNLGAVLFKAGALAEAEGHYREALEVREKLAADFPAIAEYRSQLTTTHSNLAVLLAAARKPAEAEKHYGRALDLLSGLLEQSPGAPEYRALLASTYDNLGLVLGDSTRADRKPAEAEKQHRAALVLWDGLRAEFPDIPEYRSGAADCRNHLGLLLSKMGRDEEAEEQYRQALAVREEMTAEFPDKIEYQLSLAGGYCNFGRLVVTRGELGEGLKWLDKAIALLEPRVRNEAKDMKARRFLRNSYWVRAEVYDKLGRIATATADWDEAMKLSPRREQIILREKRADSRARAGLAEEAVEDIDAIASLIAWPPGNHYNFACVYAIASDKANDADRKQEYAEKAMDMLGKAVRAGWKDAEHIATDPDLAPLRERDDFRKLLADLGS